MKKTLNLAGYRFDFSLIVRDMYNREIGLTFDENESCENKFVFRGTDGALACTEAVVSVENTENASAVKLFCSTNPTTAFDICYYLAAYDTVELRLTPEKEPDDILAAVYRIGDKSDCWTAPAHVKHFDEIPTRAMSVAWKSDDLHYHMLPMCHNSAKTDMKVKDGCFSLATSPYRSGFAAVECICAVIGHDRDPYLAAKNAVDGGFDFLGRRRSTDENTRLSDVFNYLGWCSWDSMHTDITEDGILRKAEEFNESGIPVRWILLDDGWFCENDRREALSFREDKEKFPHGLAHCVDTLKKKNNIKYVGIWEALAGDWGSIAPDSEIVRAHPDKLVRLPNGNYFPKPDEGSSFAFWNTRHAYLASCGFDFVKIDVECCVEASLHGLYASADAAEGMYKGIDGSVGIYFDGACIHCTGMGSEGLWNRPVGMVNRNSEDFEPTDVRTMSNFINCNIYNSLWHSCFNATDWDMMWSDSPTTKLNVVMHAISGAAVYLSDPHGMSKKDSILPFCLSDGKLLKADRFAMPTEDRIYRDPVCEKIALKAWSMSRGCGLIGAFNTYTGAETAIHDSLRPSDVKYIEGEKFIVYDFFTGEAKIVGRDEEYFFELDKYDAKLFLIAPLENGRTVLGDIRKYVSPAVIENEIVTDKSRIYILSEGGKFAFTGYSEAYVNGERAEISHDGILSLVDCSSPGSRTVIELRY